MKELFIGESNFAELINKNKYYVDKTKMIEDLIIKGAKVNLFPRPRRFGKSLMISTLENFFDIDKNKENEHLFDGLYISKSSVYKDNFGKYPVIKLNLKETKRDNFEDFVSQIKDVISELFIEKSYVVEKLDEVELKEFNLIKSKKGSINDFTNSIKKLSNWLERYYNKKVIILIDEYDAPISEGYMDGFYDEVMSVIKPIFSSSLKDNDSLKMGVLTGILRVSRESIFSEFKNQSIKDIMSTSYNEYFGFTKDETRELLEYYGLEYTDDVKNYYDGYNFGGLSIYNPWSILNYADEKLLKPYWANTSSNLLIKKCLASLDTRELLRVEKLIQGESTSFTYNEKLTYKDFDVPTPGNTYNLLLASGYLTLDKEELDDVTGRLIKYFKIPNVEVTEEIVRMMEEVTYGKVIQDIENYNQFQRAFSLDDKEFIENFINALLPGTSFFDTNFEYAYELYLTGLLGGFMNSNFIVKSNRESGTGRSDILIEKVDRSFGMVIEIKAAKSKNEMENLAQVALNQIKEHEYYKELELDRVKNIREYAIVFYEKSAIVR